MPSPPQDPPSPSSGPAGAGTPHAVLAAPFRSASRPACAPAGVTAAGLAVAGDPPRSAPRPASGPAGVTAAGPAVVAAPSRSVSRPASGPAGVTAAGPAVVAAPSRSVSRPACAPAGVTAAGPAVVAAPSRRSSGPAGAGTAADLTVVVVADPCVPPPALARALAAWRALGVFVRVAAGGEAAAAIALPADAAGDGAAGREETIALSPADAAEDGRLRLVPLLAAVARAVSGRVLVVAGDVVPALRSAAAFDHFGPLALLTREEVPILEEFTPSARARGPVAALLADRAALGRLAKTLAAFPSARHLPFAAPNLFLAALVRSPALGGRIFDGGLLLSEAAAVPHDDLARHLGALALLGFRAADAEGAADAAAAAAAVEAAIEADCAAGARLTAAVRRIFYAPARASASPEALARAAALADLSPTVRWNVPFNALAALAGRLLAGSDGRERIDAVLLGRSGADNLFAELLAACVLEASCRPLRAAPADGAAAPDPPAAVRAFRVRLDDGALDRTLSGQIAAAARSDEEKALFARLLALAGAA